MFKIHLKIFQFWFHIKTLSNADERSTFTKCVECPVSWWRQTKTRRLVQYSIITSDGHGVWECFNSFTVSPLPLTVCQTPTSPETIVTAIGCKIVCNKRKRIKRNDNSTSVQLYGIIANLVVFSVNGLIGSARTWWRWYTFFCIFLSSAMAKRNRFAWLPIVPFALDDQK